MKSTLQPAVCAALVLPLLIACASDGQDATTSTVGSAPFSSGGTTANAGASTGGAGTTSANSTGSTQADSATTPRVTTGGAIPTTGSGIPALVNVNLQNVLNDLSVRLQIDRANVPVNIQLPIELAANVCGVSVNVLALSGGGQGKCTATSAPQELAQVVQQQMAAGGSVGGGAQGGSTAATGGAATAGASTGGAGTTGATSSGTSETTTRSN